MNLKETEKLYTTKYFEKKYSFSPHYKVINLDIPDCYFEYCGNDYAIEVTRYFQQNSEKEHQQYVNDVEKYLQKDFFKSVHQRLGKKRSKEVCVSFYNLEEMKSYIIENIEYIKFISVAGNYFFNDNSSSGTAYCFDNIKEKMNIIEFIECVSECIISEKDVRLELITKNRYPVVIKFKYCSIPYFGKNNDKKVIPLYCWFENEEELYGNIINAIIHKNNKLLNEYIPILTKEKVNYDFYNLIVYSEGIPAKLDEEKLFNMVRKISNLKYNEIAIFLWKKIMVINNEGYDVYYTE